MKGQSYIEGRTGKAGGLTWEISQPTQIVKDAKIGDSLPGKAFWREGQGRGSVTCFGVPGQDQKVTVFDHMEGS